MTDLDTTAIERRLAAAVVCGECLWLTSADRADIIHDADVERWQVPENLAHPFRPVHRTADGDVPCGRADA
jgi:hypothetical protein